jgi:hypothetical protein
MIWEHFASGPAADSLKSGFQRPIPDCFPDCSGNFFTGSIQWSCTQPDCSGPQSLPAPTSKLVQAIRERTSLTWLDTGMRVNKNVYEIW